MNIYQRINEVRKAVDYIHKDKKVEGYMAVTHDSVTALVREHLVKHGIVIVPSIVRSVVKETGTTTSRGTPFIRCEVVYRFDVVNADDPADKFSAEIEAHALDHGDKAPGKALSYAKKALMLKLLEIESGEGEEERPEQHKPKPHKAVSGETWDKMTEKQKTAITDAAMLVIGYLDDGEDGRAFEQYEEAKATFDADEQVAFWSRFSSDQRATIKRLGEAHKKAQQAKAERKAQ